MIKVMIIMAAASLCLMLWAMWDAPSDDNNEPPYGI